MLLAVDVGNTNIVLGVIDGEELVSSGRVSTNIHETEDECAMKIYSFLNLHNNIQIDGAIISSVVPALVITLKKSNLYRLQGKCNSCRSRNKDRTFDKN